MQRFLFLIVYGVDNFCFLLKGSIIFSFTVLYTSRVHLGNGISIQLKSFVLEFLFSLYLPTEKADKQLHEALNNINMRYYSTAKL